MLEGGADIRFIQQLPGHEKLETAVIHTDGETSYQVICVYLPAGLSETSYQVICVYLPAGLSETSYQVICVYPR